MSPSTLIITHPACHQHNTGTAHPEAQKRLIVVQNALQKKKLMTKENTIHGRKATKQEILYCHTENYFRLVKEETASASPNGTTVLSTGDAQISPGSFNAALYAAGSVLTGIDRIMQNVAKTAFCLIRPPGHHASQEKGSGFCLFNNVAIGARYAQKQYGIKRVAIIDWDVHHGNGTQAIFYDDPSVFYFSTHNEAIYPGTGLAEETGENKGKGTTLNCPISPLENPKEKIKEAFSRKLTKAMESFKPEFIIISSGFDAHVSDPLGGFNLDDSDFAELTGIVKEIAGRSAQGRILSVLEGGYDLDGLGSAVKAHIAALSHTESG